MHYGCDHGAGKVRRCRDLRAVGGPKWTAFPMRRGRRPGCCGSQELDLFRELAPRGVLPGARGSLEPEARGGRGLDIHDRARAHRRGVFRRTENHHRSRHGQSESSTRKSTTPMKSSASPAFAFDLARKRRNKLTSMEKRNVMKSGVLWNEVVTQVHAREYKDVQLEHQLADSAA